MNKIDFQKLEKREDMIIAFNDLKNDYRLLLAINDDFKQELQRKDNIINELKEWLEIKEEKETVGTFSDVLDKIKELEKM